MIDRNTGARRPATAAQRPVPRTAQPQRTAPRTAQRTAARTVQRPAARGQAGLAAARDRRYGIVKWALLAALLAYTFLVARANSARDVDFSVISSRMAAAPGIDVLEPLDENAFQDRFGITPEGCEGWLLYGAEEIMNVSELMIAKADDAALDRLEDAAQGRVDAQLAVFRGYGVEQTAHLESARLFTRGSYIFYAVGENADAWEDAFLSCVR